MFSMIFWMPRYSGKTLLQSRKVHEREREKEKEREREREKERERERESRPGNLYAK